MDNMCLTLILRAYGRMIFHNAAEEIVREDFIERTQYLKIQRVSREFATDTSTQFLGIQFRGNWTVWILCCLVFNIVTAPPQVAGVS